MGVLAPWIPALECEFQWIDAVSVLVFAKGAAPVIGADYLRVEH